MLKIETKEIKDECSVYEQTDITTHGATVGAKISFNVFYQTHLLSLKAEMSLCG